MTATISEDGKTVQIQLPVGRRQLAGALSFLRTNYVFEYDLNFNEKSKE